MLVAVIVLAGVLVWVIRNNLSAPSGTASSTNANRTAAGFGRVHFQPQQADAAGVRQRERRPTLGTLATGVRDRRGSVASGPSRRRSRSAWQAGADPKCFLCRAAATYDGAAEVDRQLLVAARGNAHDGRSQSLSVQQRPPDGRAAAARRPSSPR